MSGFFQDVVSFFSDMFKWENLPFFLAGVVAFVLWVAYLMLREHNAGRKRLIDIKEIEEYRQQRLDMERDLKRENHETGLSMTLQQKLEMMEPTDERFMDLITIEETKEGMELAKSLLIDKQNALMRRGAVLSSEMIHKLKHWGVAQLWIKRGARKIV